MFVSEDGYVSGSIDVSKLDEVEAKSDEAKARLEQLKAERDAAQAGADAEAERLAKLAEAQSIPGQVQEPAADQKSADQKPADEKASTRRSASASDKG